MSTDAHAHAPSDAHGGGGGHHEHIHTVSHYTKIWGILCVLLVASVIGPFIGDFLRENVSTTLGLVMTLTTAFGIAFVKAGMVIKYFMHLDMEKPFIWYILITGLVFMVLFFSAVAPDVMNHEGTNWENVAAKAEVARGLAAGSTAGGHHQEHLPEGEHKAEGEHKEAVPEGGH